MRHPFDTFDQIAVIHCAKDKARLPGLLCELERVGILPDDDCRFRVHFTSIGEVEKKLYDAGRTMRLSLPATDAQTNNGLQHLQVIRAAFLSGANNLLILEDDIRFLKDESEIARIISAWNREEYPVCLFDKFLWSDTLQRDTRPFVPFTKGVRGASCYALTRRGIEATIAAEDNLMRNRGQLLVGDQVFDWLSVPCCFSRKNVCVQRDFNGAMNHEIYSTQDADVYRKNGVDLSLYAEA